MSRGKLREKASRRLRWEDLSQQYELQGTSRADKGDDCGARGEEREEKNSQVHLFSSVVSSQFQGCMIWRL